MHTHTPRQLDLFTGTGSLGLAVENVFGATTTAYAEFEPHLDPVLQALFPDVPNLRDVTTANWDHAGGVEIITNGSPCTDISVLGRRAGMGPDTRSGLWSSTCTAITHLEPDYVVWENVRGALSTRTAAGADMRALGRVLADLHTLGYDAQWHVVKASDIGAPHGRARVFLLAHRRTTATLRPQGDLFAYYTVADSWAKPTTGAYTQPWPANGAMIDGHAYHARPVPPVWSPLPVLRTPVSSEAGGGPLSITAAAARGQTLRLTGQILSLWHPGVLPETEGTTLRAPGWHEYAPAIHRWEGIMGREHPAPTIPGRTRPRLNPVFAEWMVGLEHGHITNPAHGLTHKQMLAGAGNIAVRQQAEHGIGHMHANLIAAPAELAA